MNTSSLPIPSFGFSKAGQALVLGCLFVALAEQRVPACCAVSRAVDQVVNADQTVIIIWDAAKQQQHFIRQASFKSDAKDIGFIVPSPSKPELEEAGDAAFASLKRITAPLVRRPSGGCGGIGCSASMGEVDSAVVVLERKRVAGFDAVVLQAGTSEALVQWLADNGYAYSDAVAAWAEPYVKRGWPFTALKVAAGDAEPLEASALRISFTTDTPLFPYREPDSAAASQKLGVRGRLLRIYFIAEHAYEGAFETGEAWSGRRVWSNDITHFREMLLGQLKLTGDAVPERWWLTEFEDRWPYAQAPGDVVFAESKNKRPLHRSTRSGKAPVPVIAGLFLILVGMRRAFRR